MLNTEQLESIRSWAQSGAELAEQSLREHYTGDFGLEIRDLQCAPLSELPERLGNFDGECVAGAMQRFSGKLTGTALFAMGPEDALTWVRAGETDQSPVESYLGLASEIQTRLVKAIGEGLGASVEVESVSLQEDPVPVILFNTHAPSDTTIVCVRALVAAGDHVLPLNLYLMLEPKVITSALAH
jgi:hypothetical protein